MVLEAPMPDLLAHIRLSDVARRAEVSTGALYYYWDSQDAYRADLLAELLSPRRYPMRESVDEMVRDAAEGGLTLSQLIQYVCEENIDQFFGNPDFRVQVAMWLTSESGVRTRLAEQYERVGREWVDFYQTVFEVYGLKLREPFTFAWLATLLTGLLEGLILRAGVDESAVPLGGIIAPGGEDWSLFSCAVLAMLPGMTQDVSASSTSVWEWVGERKAQSLGHGRTALVD
jgi:AcrR family transcriptional regulator